MQASRPRLLVIDNYDSFTYNLVQAFAELGAEIEVCRNDTLTAADALARRPSHLLISPGPGRPEDGGVTLSLIEAALGRLPILGVCLGHQALAVACGGRVVAAKALMHGKSSLVTHDGQGLFVGLPQPVQVGRYHSLAVEESSLPVSLEVTARSPDGEIMGIRHRAVAAFGVQFHPESVLCPDGPALMRNFLAQQL
jgi:anthranilate synthase/aminodeoxychorismate synthase-like glutamine amidotransferase